MLPCAGARGKFGAIIDRNGFILAGLLATVTRSGARLKGSTFPGAAFLRFPTGQEGNLFAKNPPFTQEDRICRIPEPAITEK